MCNFVQEKCHFREATDSWKVLEVYDQNIMKKLDRSHEGTVVLRYVLEQVMYA
jgi:hypothetical protein